MTTPVKAIGALVLVVVAAVAFWLLRPLFVDDVVDESFPASAGAQIPEGMTADEVESEMAAAAAGPDITEVEPMPAADPVAQLTGSFGGADAAHQGEGTATIYELEEGVHVLRLEDFNVTNGPDLHVYLTPLDAAGTPDIHADGVVDLGSLKGNVGDQNYDIPGDVAVDQPLGVVIYCVPFSVVFATAALA